MTFSLTAYLGGRSALEGKRVKVEQLTGVNGPFLKISFEGLDEHHDYVAIGYDKGIKQFVVAKYNKQGEWIYEPIEQIHI